MNDNNQLTGSAISQHFIKVYGIGGQFSVGSEDNSSPYKVRYFNTVASSSNDARAGNSRELLNELKPMRERTRSSELNDLSALLQRELNDYRVAHDLIPYLKGKNTEVGFFPGILVALVPKQFLQGGNEKSYPAPEQEKENTQKYGNYWSLETFEVGKNPTSLGVLSINPNETDIIVLDGQHRANAFRYMAGSFPDATEDTIYSPFYQACDVPAEYTSELPVTVVWFESSEKPISPVLISRRLFVDVNTNARPVQESRNILLDDHDLASIAATNVYSTLAERGFDKGRLSLLHSGFDVEEARSPSLSLFSPALMKYCFSYFLLGGDAYDSISRKISRDASAEQGNKNRFIRLVGGATHKMLENVENGKDDELDNLHQQLQKELSPAVTYIFDEFCFTQPHFKAAKQIEDFISNSADHVMSTVWDKIFCGGEGLYSSFAELPDEGKASPYKNAIRELEKNFLRDRANHFSAKSSMVNQAYDTFCSKASITGLFMSFAKFGETHKTPLSKSVVEQFVTALNVIGEENWIHVLTTLKRRVAPSLAPKEWVAMRKLYLRVIQEAGEIKPFTESNIGLSPDWSVATSHVDQRAQAWKTDNPSFDTLILPDAGTISGWIDDTMKTVKETLTQCGLKPIYTDNILSENLTAHLESWMAALEQEWEQG